MQNKGRKRTGAIQSPSELAGTMVKTVDGKEVLLVSQKKRDRGKFVLISNNWNETNVFWFTCQGLTRVCAFILREFIRPWTRVERVGMKMVES